MREGGWLDNYRNIDSIFNVAVFTQDEPHTYIYRTFQTKLRIVKLFVEFTVDPSETNNLASSDPNNLAFHDRQAKRRQGQVPGSSNVQRGNLGPGLRLVHFQNGRA